MLPQKGPSGPPPFGVGIKITTRVTARRVRSPRRLCPLHSEPFGQYIAFGKADDTTWERPEVSYLPRRRCPFSIYAQRVSVAPFGQYIVFALWARAGREADSRYRFILPKGASLPLLLIFKHSGRRPPLCTALSLSVTPEGPLWAYIARRPFGFQTVMWPKGAQRARRQFIV